MSKFTNRNCMSCVFSGQAHHHSGITLCRYNPPVAMMNYDSGKVQTRFPFVDERDWCRNHTTEDEYDASNRGR